jgi:hypothetical protein
MSARTVAIIALVVSILALIISVREMAHRISAYVGTREQPRWMFRTLDQRVFQYAGKQVTITDHDAPAGVATTSVHVRYGDTELKLPATLPPMQAELPGLIRHQDWLRVVRFAQGGREDTASTAAKIESGEVTDRLAVIVRRPPAGTDPAAPGLAGRRKWKFDFYEFKPAGGFDTQRELLLPERERDYAKRVAAATEKGEPAPQPLANAMTPGSWQADAAMLMMPTEPMFSAAYSPAPKHALGPVRAMGWTLPSAAFSGLALLASFVVFAVARRRPATLVV